MRAYNDFVRIVGVGQTDGSSVIDALKIPSAFIMALHSQVKGSNLKTFCEIVTMMTMETDVTVVSSETEPELEIKP